MQNKLVILLNKAYSEIGIPTKKIFDIFYYLRDGSKVDNFELIRKTGIAKNTINSVKEYFNEVFGSASTTTQVDQKLSSELDNLFITNYLPDENLLNLSVNSDTQEVFPERVTPLREYDQFTATQETVLKRANLLKHFEDIDNKKLLFLGDDDFTSISVARLGKTVEIVVLDIDERILNKIKSTSDRLGLNIKTIKHDLTKELPKELTNRFDVVFTDPPYTAEGVRLFLSRSITSLNRDNLAARIYLCYGNSDRAKERFLPIYRSIIDSGLMLRYVFDKFNRYFGAESIGSTSSMLVLDVTPKVKTLIKGDYANPIYTND